MLADLHIHPDWSPDATGSVEEFAESAIKRGLTQICFTTHIELDPARKAIDSYMRYKGMLVPINKKIVRVYIDEVKKVAEKYNSKLDIRVGFEIGWGESFASIIADFLEGIPVDYVIGSVHTIDGVAISSSKEAKTLLARNKPECIARAYIEELISAAKSGLFDALGHIDGYKKYAPLVYDSDWELMDRGLMRELLMTCKATGVLIELNTASTRKPWHREFYPSEWVIELMSNCGFEYVPLVSDAHRPEEVGWEFEKAEELLVRYGLKPYIIEA